jgi:hypothetical protein
LVLGSTPGCQRILFTNHHGKERIESQKIMIIEILVASGQPQQTRSLCGFDLWRVDTLGIWQPSGKEGMSIRLGMLFTRVS